MELFQELFLTAALSLVLAFLLVKLISMASSEDIEQESVFRSGKEHKEQMKICEFGEEERSFEGELRNQVLESERIVESVGEAVKVDKFEGELVHEESEVVHGGKEFVREVKEEGEEEEEVNSVELERKSVEEEVRADASPEDGGLEDNLVEESIEKVEVCEIGLELGKQELIIVKNEHDGVVDHEGNQENKIGVEKNGEDGENECLFSDEDDWEGIERSEVEKLFGAAATFAGSGDKNDCLSKLGSDVQMQLYGLHKVATEGPCHESQPLALMVSARAKWNAWQQLGNMSPEVAMEQYITILSDSVPGWMGENPDGESKQDKSNNSPEAGVSGTEAPALSSFLHHQPSSKYERKPKEVQSCDEGGDVIGGPKIP